MDGMRGPDVTDFVSVMQVDDEDEVVITVTPPEPEEAEKDMEEAMQVKPHSHAELQFGRTIDEMFEHIDENLATLPHGIKGQMTAAFAHTVFQAAEAEMGGPGYGPGYGPGNGGPSALMLMG